MGSFTKSDLFELLENVEDDSPIAIRCKSMDKLFFDLELGIVMDDTGGGEILYLCSDELDDLLV